MRFQPTFGAMPAATLNKISPGSFLKRFLKINLYTLGRLLPNLVKPAPRNEDLSGKIWLYVVSQNNYDALHFLKEQLPETVFVAGQNKQIGRYNQQVNRLSLRWKFFYTARFFLPVFLGLFKMHGSKAIRFFDLIFVSIGYYEAYLKHLQKHRPRAIVFANDHNDDSRAMLLAANKLNIPTVYIQHATVSTAFPPLEFTLSLLEGQDALDKYRQCGPVQGEVKLIGMPKADKFMQFRNFKTTLKNVGIAGNLMDEYDALKATILQLVLRFPDLEFTFRPHPGDARDFSFVTGKNAMFSSPKSEGAFEFLKNQDLLVAAESSIHLEAALLNIPGIYFRLGANNFYDYYGFVKTGLIAEAATEKELFSLVQQYQQDRPEVYQKAAYYNATIGTENEGKSDALAVQYLQEFLQKTLPFQA
ncbi:hypothetical protein I5M27_12345 [Adhaeribacter sp. BT258]|uniref:CDP-Glycerol:Poly(Glycerophosphate) glycerophosphotransferase n=1 Tax=Adhaeribacter terrigena TaxID=2793070 RepID=A0ABS1C307_9BACT|nr:hypothetical protein [Adhaeribacter terrigena]